MCTSSNLREGSMLATQMSANGHPAAGLLANQPLNSATAHSSAIETKVEPRSKNQLRLVFWETTSGCNLECIHCRRIDVAAALAKQDMSTEQGMRFIDSLADCAKPILVFSGGEPLYRKDLFDLARHARNRGITTALATNGTLIDELTANKIVAAGFQRVAISIDGADAETHDRFRGIPGSFVR